MRYVRIFLLHFEEAFEYRSRSLVWFLIALINPLLYLLFWRGAFMERQSAALGISLSEISSYYFLLIIAGALLTVHIEEDVAYRDIKEGGLVKYLTKPYSYFWLKFFEEIPWRLIQGTFGVIVLLLFTLFFGQFFKLATSQTDFFLAILISILAYFLSFVFKMIIGLTALWIIDHGGLQQLVTVVSLVFGGFVIPLEFFGPTMKAISFLLPFPYMIYYPVLAFQGRLDATGAFSVIAGQMAWLLILYGLYVQFWKNGTKKFTGIGQ